MHAIIPYLILVGVIIAFFIVCYLVFRESPKKMGHLSEERRADRRRKIREYASGAASADILQSDATSIPKSEETTAVKADEGLEKADEILTQVKLSQEDTSYPTASVHEPTPESMTLVIPPAGEGMLDETIGGAKEEASLEATQVMGRLSHAGDETAPTMILRRDQLSEALAQQGLMESNPVADPDGMKPYSNSSWKQESAEKRRVEIAMEPFLHVFGVISDRTYQVVFDVTQEALQALEINSEEEARALLDNVVVQEALLLMQKAYAANPADWMRPIAVEAFVDVVSQPKSSTPYLVAFDALKILSHMTLAHLQVMAIILLLQYSRNSNNYSLEYFRHYVDKYIQPFLSDLPRNAAVFHQLDYLRCSQKESEKINLAQLLSNSYSFVFNFRGFSKDELVHALDGENLDPRFVVKSINSALYKLALVDEGMAPRFFRQAGISDRHVQEDLLGLMKSKPSAFSGAEARRIMEEISPVLLDLSDLFEVSPLSTMSLTLLGLYLGRAHVKATIHEDFDLSQWF